VAGILPPGFRLELPHSGDDFWLPLKSDHFLAGSRAITTFEVFARLKPQVEEETARAELETLGRQLQAAYPETNQGRGVGLLPLAEQVSGAVRPALLTLLAAVGMLLLLASFNLANLFLARGAARQREIALRGALGAGRGRIVRMLLTESLIVALAGGLCGLLLAAAIVMWAPDLLPPDFPRWQAVGLDPLMLAFALGLSLASGIVFGLAPALAGVREDPAAWIRHSGAGPASHRLRSGLVVAQVSLALALLIGAGLLGGSLSSLMNLDPGFRTDSVLTFRLALPPSTYGSRAKVAGYVGELRQRLESLPEVGRASAVSGLPLSGHNVGSSLNIEGRPLPISQAPAVGWQFVAPGFFEAMGIPLLQGRDFVDADLQGEHLVIINRSLARNHFPSQHPIGKRIELGLPRGDWHRIIGIVGDVRHRSLEAEPTARAYDLLGQHAELALTVVVHTAVEPSLAAEPIRRQVSELDDQVPLFALATTAEVRSRSVATRRLVTLLMAALASTALLLAAVGIFGVLSYTVQRRTSEFGVRMALGARSRDILKLVVGQGLLLTIIGGMIGLLASLGLSRFLSGLLYGVSPTDPSTILLMALLLAFVALLSCAIPARRASRIDPQSALRTE
ncbi:MAG: ADOP family duplicated permease, partial [Acidobacteriota bacterium]